MSVSLISLNREEDAALYHQTTEQLLSLRLSDPSEHPQHTTIKNSFSFYDSLNPDYSESDPATGQA